VNTFIHLSDLHIRWHKNAAENRSLQFVVEQIVQTYDQQEKPAVLITGDLTDDGRKDQYHHAANLLYPLKEKGFPLFIVPGNHDYGPEGNIYLDVALRNFEQIILRDLLGHNVPETGEFYPHIVELGSLVFVGVDSVVANEDQPVHFASGEVGPLQRRLLREALCKYLNTDKTIVTYFHHHPFDRHRVMKLDDATEMMQLLSGRTDFLCFGHDHVEQRWEDYMGIDYILASGKSTEQNRRGQYVYTEVTVTGKGQHAVTRRSFKR